ncbi:LysM peptidoglycan-binding domain-containing protein, partial [Cumulibacter manganitolerans]|uniref:LysM peptidoglycan-binding domain-containing protein n=1 Tax=Cumulibacter manganitolerans TaxID=1884992 RepID=UPI001E299EE6
LLEGEVVDTEGAAAVVLPAAQLALVGICAWAGLATMLWWAASAHPSPALLDLTRRLTPASWRAPLALALGAGTLGLSACGSPAPPTGHALEATAPAYAASSDAFDWPTSAPPATPAAPDPGPAPPPTSGRAVVVTDGDCLWSIAATELGPGAEPAEIAYLVEAIYDANADIIGADPDLLRPGATLTIPGSTL